MPDPECYALASVLLPLLPEYKNATFTILKHSHARDFQRRKNPDSLHGSPGSIGSQEKISIYSD